MGSDGVAVARTAEGRYRHAMADPRFDSKALLERAASLSLAYLTSLPTRHVGPRANAADIAARLHVPLPEAPEDPQIVIERLARDLELGLVGSAGPRYYGFVIGGALPPQSPPTGSLRHGTKMLRCMRCRPLLRRRKRSRAHG